MGTDTAATAECVHGIADPAWCSICRHGPLTHRVARAEPGVTITARQRSWCTGCDDPVHPGQQITRWSDDQWRHEGCEP